MLDDFAGITPACAGKTIRAGTGASVAEDHPRMRGEDVKWVIDTIVGYGSPPHARGRRRRRPDRGPHRGITPACAGKTPTTTSAKTTEADHPRMRGEDATAVSMSDVVVGSPPHARGRPRPVRIPPGGPGITPACAGKTQRRTSIRAPRRDHPRMRGEDVVCAVICGQRHGSPPHARGRQRQIFL